VRLSYRIEGSENSVEGRAGGEKPMKWARSNKPKIERWRRGRDHTEGVLQAHEENECASENAWDGVVLEEPTQITESPFTKRGPV